MIVACSKYRHAPNNIEHNINWEYVLTMIEYLYELMITQLKCSVSLYS